LGVGVVGGVVVATDRSAESFERSGGRKKDQKLMQGGIGMEQVNFEERIEE